MLKTVVAAAIVGLASAQGSTPFKTARLTVENSSNRTIQITHVRWLNLSDDTWHAMPVSSGNLLANHEWKIEFPLQGLNVDSKSTFISIQYIMLDQASQTWSPIMDGKQVHVELTQDTANVRLDVARRNL